jgi:hypothetical protein
LRACVARSVARPFVDVTRTRPRRRDVTNDMTSEDDPEEYPRI